MNVHVLKNKLAQIFFVLISLSFSSNVLSTDYQQKKSFNIPKQRAMLSLISFAEQADITLLFPASGLENVNTNSLIGQYSITQALQLLIKDSGLLMGLEASGEVSILVDQAFVKQQKLSKTKSETVAEKDKKSYKKQFFKTQKKIAEMEVITIQGVRGSLQQSMNRKRFSSEIMDSISSEDIGQLPDENIAEALQRVTGVQMSRSSDGEGSTIQIRGISDNNVEINGQVASGSSGNRNINFQDISSELFSGIEVLKTPTAQRIEGSLGGTVNLKTRRPLNINKDHVATVKTKAKYAESKGEKKFDFNVFLAKNFRGSDYGDIGFILNGSSKNINSRTDAYGAGDFQTATGLWQKKTGVDEIKGGDKNPFIKAGPFQYIVDDNGYANVDVNGDGVADENDVFYMPAGFRSFTRAIESQRDSINTSIQWQPNDELNLYFDFTYHGSKQDESGSSVNAQINADRSYILADGEQTFNEIGNGNFILESGMIGAANLRLGGAPSNKTIWRSSNKFTFGGDYQLTDSFKIGFVINAGDGDSRTSQSNLNMAYDFNQNNNINQDDNTGIVEFSYANSLLPFITYYDSPFGTNAPSAVEDLKAIDITSLTHPDLKFIQMQRNADDANNEDASVQLDFIYELDWDFLSSFTAGIRSSTKQFRKQSWHNQNQNKGAASDGLIERVNIRQVAVNPDFNVSEKNKKIAQDLQQCFTDVSIELNHGGNMPSSWGTTDCDSDFFTDYFGMHDIRAYSESRGAGYYERPESQYNVEEETLALYAQTNFLSELAGLEVFGNFGVRYIDTTTTSTGLVDSQPGVKPITYSDKSFAGDYQEFLPSVNVNLALNEDSILRFAAYKAISRPSLTKLSPGIKLSLNSELVGASGTAELGNPNLKPIKATNVDLSYEWYYSASSMISVAVFYKNLDSVIGTSPVRTPIEISGLLWLSTQPINLPGTKIKGYEFSLQHSFDHFDGLFSHTGVGANYTYTSENSELFDQEGDQIKRKGLSKYSYNLSTYYDDGSLSLRLAYAWRDDFVRRENVVLGFASPYLLPEIEKARGQLDFSANYTIDKHFKVNFSAVNLNESTTERYLKYPQLINYISDSGVRYSLSVLARF
jgi:TonB-dependent receptor